VQEIPHLRAIAPDHYVSCHRAEELDLAGVTGLGEELLQSQVEVTHAH
jgi:hypothetical protein